MAISENMEGWLLLGAKMGKLDGKTLSQTQTNR